MAKKSKRPPMVDAGSFLGHGLTWAVSTGFFLFVGWQADGWLGTRPLLTIVGAFVGAGAGFYSLYHHLVVAPREQEKQRKGEK